MCLQHEAPKLESYCVISPPYEDGLSAWVVDHHVMLGESDVVSSVIERAYPYQGVGEGCCDVSLGGEVVTYLGNGKG